MRVSLTEAAQLLGLTPRQVRYRIQKGELKAHKSGGRWVLDDAQLPVTSARRKELDAREGEVRAAVESALKPRNPGARYTVRTMRVLQSGVACWKLAAAQLGTDHAATRSLASCNLALTRGGHSYHDRAKAEHFRLARQHAADAVGWLLMAGDDAAGELIDRIEAEVLPALAGLLRRHERGRQR